MKSNQGVDDAEQTRRDQRKVENGVVFLRDGKYGGPVLLPHLTGRVGDVTVNEMFREGMRNMLYRKPIEVDVENDV